MTDRGDEAERPWPDEGPSNWRCDVCGETFETKDIRDEHEREQHGGGAGQESTQDNLAGDQARESEFHVSGDS